MKDEILEIQLRTAPLAEPVGGLDAARERMMGRVRHQFPAELSLPRRSFWQPVGATVLAGAAALVLFLAWPQQRAEADPLPTEAQMEQFYDQHEVHHSAHLQTLKVSAAQ